VNDVDNKQFSGFGAGGIMGRPGPGDEVSELMPRTEQKAGLIQNFSPVFVLRRQASILAQPCFDQQQPQPAWGKASHPRPTPEDLDVAASDRPDRRLT